MLEVLLIAVLGIFLLMFFSHALGLLIGLIVLVPYHLIRSTAILCFWILKAIWAVIAFPFRLVGIGR